MTTPRIDENWQSKFLNKGTELGCGDLSIMIGTVSEILDKVKDEAHQAGIDEMVDENTSDGYHTFKELYEFRLLYNAHLFNEWSKQGMYKVHKSTKHSDGEDCFGGGWFIVVATLPGGDISNHYEMKDWDLFQCEVRETAKEWDGHTSQDVAKRLRQALNDTIKALQDNK